MVVSYASALLCFITLSNSDFNFLPLVKVITFHCYINVLLKEQSTQSSKSKSKSSPTHPRGDGKSGEVRVNQQNVSGGASHRNSSAAWNKSPSAPVV